MPTVSDEPSREAWVRAVASRDTRFDGWVTVGVTSTGIYCRPSCPTPVRPKPQNLRFFATPAAAQQAGFRACKRCAPDAAPGSPEWNRRNDLVGRAIRAIDDGVVDRCGVDGLARHLAVSPRHLTRVLVADVGAPPLALARARRARTARVLIETTGLRFADVALAAGFDSVRQFNETVREVFASSPSQLRARSARRPDPIAAGGDGLAVSLRLPFRPPYNAHQVLGRLGTHGIPGIESLEDGRYRRSLRLPGGPALAELEVRADHVAARFRLSSLRDLQTAVHRCRRLLDLDADPGVVDEWLGADPLLAPSVAAFPGTRAPADADGLEAVLRAIIHQQVSVAGAVAVLGRLTARLGSPLGMGDHRVTTVFPAAEVWAEADPSTFGLPAGRARTIVEVSRAVASGRIDLSPGADRDAVRVALRQIKGIGPWTVAIASLRALSDPDVVVPGDLAVRRVADALGVPATDAGLEAASSRWRPWRSYAMHHLWQAYQPRSRTEPPS